MCPAPNTLHPSHPRRSLSGFRNDQVLCRRPKSCVHRKLLIRTTSLLVVLRPYASRLPSGDQSKLKKVPEVKLVNCFGGPPSSGWIQRFVTPDRAPPCVRWYTI